MNELERAVTARDVAKWLSDNKDKVAIVAGVAVLEIARVVHIIENKSQHEGLTIVAKAIPGA